MYFSKNSRYVLQKAQWFTPSSCLLACLKGSEKTLSVKYPKEDPTKPPLRRNIPTDPVDHNANVSETSGRSISKQRSRSLISKSVKSSASVFDNGSLPRSESEIQLPKFTPEQYFSTENAEKEDSISMNEFPNRPLFNAADEVMGEFLSGNFKNDSTERTPSHRDEGKKQIGNKVEAQELQMNEKGSSGAKKDSDKNNSDHSVLHIIIDFPQKGDENLSSTEQNQTVSIAARLSDGLAVAEKRQKEMPMPKLKQPKKWRSKSLSKINAKGREKRFEIYEIEDSGTYVLHLKLKNTTGVEVVPEKEVRTRNTTFQDSFARMPKPFSKAFQKTPKKISAISDSPEIIKYPEKKKKKSKVSKREMKHKSSSLPQINKEANENVQANEFLNWQQPQYYELPVSDSFEENKILKALSKDNFGAIRSSNSKMVYETPKEKEETKATEPLFVENVTVDDEAKAEKPAMEMTEPPRRKELQTEFTAEEPAVELTEPPRKKELQAEFAEEESAVEMTESPRKEEFYAEPAAEEQIMAKEEAEFEDSQHAKDEEFTISSYRDPPHHYTEKVETAPDDSRPPPTDWIVPSFMRSTANQPYSQSEDKPQPKKKSKKISSNNKKPKGKNKKKSTYGSGSKIARSERYDYDVTDFKNGASSVSIKCDKPTCAMKLSAAYPPLLNEAMKRRYYRFRDDSVYNNTTIMRLQPKDFEMNPKCVEASVVNISNRVNRSDFVGCSGSRGLDNNETISKISDNISDIANEKVTQNKGMAPLDSLTVMKRVKEIIDLDLSNAIKIFTPDSVGVVTSVMVSKENGEWTLDEKELRKCLIIQKSEFLNDIKRAESTRDFFGDATINAPKYLPSTEESRLEIKLDQSVVTFHPDTNKFIVDLEDLQEAIKRRTEESFNDVVVEKLEGLLTGSKAEPILVFNSADDEKMMLKSGDSILVFDEETQQWKVDYSILEKRQQKMKVEEELSKRSELILETIEKLEKNNIPTIPKPETRDRKTFDYNKKQWKDYGSEKKPKNKMKSPFKESDAKEIRKKNSDLFEDLFVKKDKTKKCGAIDATQKNKLCKQSSTTESGMTKESAVTPKSPGTASDQPEPISQKKESPSNQTEDDNYWETFLNMDIPNRSYKEIADVTDTKKPKIRAPGPPPPPPLTPPTPPKPPVSPPTGPKIEEPKFRIKLPFMEDVNKKKDKGIPAKKPQSKEEKSKVKPPTAPKANEKPKLKSSVPPTKTEKPKEPKVKIPPIKQPPATKKEEPKAKQPSAPSAPSSSSPITPQKKNDPKIKPSSTVKKEEPKERLTSNKKKEKDLPSSSSPLTSVPKADDKKDPKVKAPPPSSMKPKEDPKTGGKKDKAAADHYISKNIVELSRNSKDKNSKIKSNKIETVKLNITADKRLPSKVMEINLNKKCEKPKETSVASKKDKKHESGIDNINFYKKFEKYKTPYSDPEFEEKSMKIKSDIASNPNLKKLGNWNKTLVLHDIAKPPENIESWLKDETDKMATLLLKVLQEATDGKPRRKSSRPKLTEKSHAKANPYDNIRKKQEATSNEKFLFKPTMPAKPGKIIEIKAPAAKAKNPMKTSTNPTKAAREGKPPTLGFETTDSWISKDFLQHSRLANEITDDIPGPEILKRLSNTWKVFPIFSVQITIFTLLRLFQLDANNPDKSRRQAFGKLFAKYGPIVNVQGPLSGSVILVHKPEHLSAVFEQDASIPVRSVFDSLEHSRREAEDKYLTVGMCSEWNSSQWLELKRNTNDPLIKGCEKFFSTAEAASDSLVSNIRKNRNQQNYASDDFMEEIKRWSLEGLCSVLFEKSFGFLEGRSRNMSWILEPDKLYMSIEEATGYLSKCERGFQTWRLMTTPSVIGLKQSYRTLSGIIAKQIYQAEANLRNKSEMLKENKMLQVKDLTFLESMLLNDGMTPEEITCNLIDIMLIGTSAMSSALGFLLYELAQNIKIQNKLIKEVKNNLPEKNSQLDCQKLHSLKYLQACLKESLRLHMPVPLFYRMLQNDILLSNYIVPKGTFVVMDYRVSCMKEQIFDEPEKFLPERWLQDEKWIQSFHPFSTLPLCHGPRAELSKKVVEMQILACIAKILRNFHIEYPFGEIQGTDSIISFPDKPLKFNFIERDF